MSPEEETQLLYRSGTISLRGAIIAILLPQLLMEAVKLLESPESQLSSSGLCFYQSDQDQAPPFSQPQGSLFLS